MVEGNASMYLGSDRMVEMVTGEKTTLDAKRAQPYLNGAMIDFVDSIEKQGFTIDNPNAGGSCACGDSFN